MKNRIFTRVSAAVFAAALVISVSAVSAYAAGSLSYFENVRTYASGTFSDVPDGAWYAGDVRSAYDLGLIDGKSAGQFDPDSYLTAAEAVKLAACLNSIYTTGSAPFVSSEPWYQTYADYAQKVSVIDPSFRITNTRISRADFALLLSKALPDEALAPINTVDDNAIPDVSMDYSYAPAVYELYRAGVLTGETSSGAFYPLDSIKRSAVAAMIVRMAEPDSRVSFTMNAALTAEQVFSQCSPAVFYIEIYDAKGTTVKTGSGFFLSSDGLAVTNFHVVKGASSAKITTSDGTVYNVSGIYDYDEADDVALIQVDGSGFSSLELGDSDAISSGAPVYTIGAPLGLNNSMSSGIVSYADRVIDGVSYIQTDAPISPGSSGGPLLDQYGKVVGITSAGATSAYSQNLNLAMPINDVLSLSSGGALSGFSSLMPAVTYYPEGYPAVDFGAQFGVAPIYSSNEMDTLQYDYALTSLPGDESDLLAQYGKLLEYNNFELYGSSTDPSQIALIYYNSAYDVTIYISNTTLQYLPDGTPCLEIVVSY